MPKWLAVAFLLVLAAATVWAAGCTQTQTPKAGLVGFFVSVPVSYRVQYSSLPLGEAVSDMHDERIKITATVDTGGATGKPVYARDFAAVAKAWVGQRIPGLDNQQGIADDATLMENTAPQSDKDFCNYVGAFSDDEGWPVYVSGRWTYTFITADGSVAYTKMVRSCVLLRVPALDDGSDVTVHQTTVGVYIPKWRLPTSDGPLTLRCQIEYELAQYTTANSGLGLVHRWSRNDIFDAVKDKIAGVIRSAIDAVAARIDETIAGIDYTVRAVVEPLANITSGLIPVNLMQNLGFGLRSVQFYGHKALNEAEKILDLRGYSNPQFVTGAGEVKFSLTPDTTTTNAIILRPKED